MAQQIKKKYLQNDSVDGTKLKLLQGQSVRGEDSTGQEVDLVNLDESDKVLLKGEEAALKSQVDAEQSRAEGEETRIEGKLDQEVLDRESGDSALQSQIISLQGAEDILFEDNASVYADGAAAIEDPTGRDGWFFRSAGNSNKINWYFHDGQANPVTVGQFQSLHTIATVDSSSNDTFHLAYYTFPLGDGQDAGSWYRSRIVYVPSGNFERGVKTLFYMGQEPDASVYPDLPRVQMTVTTVAGSNVGLNEDSEVIMTAVLGTNSGAQEGTVQLLVNKLSFNSSVFSKEYSLEIRGEFTLAGIKQSLLEEAIERQSGDSALQANIDIEESRALSEEARIEGKLDQEVSDRQAADITLQSNIDTEKARIDAILQASDADKDSFAEIVNLINSVDTENDSAFASYVLSNDAALAQEVSDREDADNILQSDINTIKQYKPEQVIYVSKNGVDTNTGSEQLPFLTIGAALSSITDASPTNRYAIRVSSGTYVETSISLKANVFIIGEGAKEAVRIDSTISMDSSFSGSGDHRSGFANVLILKAANFDWSSVTSAAGKLYFSQTVFGSTVNMYGHNNAIAQAQFADCQFFGKLTISGINVSVFHNNLCWSGVELNQHPNGGMATVFNAVGGTIGGELKLTTTVDDFNRRCSAFLKSCYTGQITINGVKSYVDATNDSIPSAGATILNSGNLIRLNDAGVNKDLSNLSYPTAVNQPIMPANSNATNMGDWGKQWFFNFAYVHASSGTDLYLISSMGAYDGAGDDTGRSIFIQADSYGLKENVDGGNVSISTTSVSGTGTRGKISLDGREVDVSNTQIKNLADATDATDAVTKQQLDVEKARIDAILNASDADKDSFAEIVNLINSVDTENDTAFAGYVSSNDAALAQEISTREAADQALQSQIDSLVQFAKESIEVTAQMISDTYVDLQVEIKPNSMVMFVDRLGMHEGLDYSVSTVNGVSRITFLSPMLEPSEEAIEAGQFIRVTYAK